MTGLFLLVQILECQQHLKCQASGKGVRTGESVEMIGKMAWNRIGWRVVVRVVGG